MRTNMAILAAAIALCLGSISPCFAQIITTDTVGDDHGVKMTSRDCKIPLLNGSITYSRFLKGEPAPGKIFNGCIRMNFGINEFNGGWDNSSFFKVYYKDEWKRNLLQDTEAEKVALTPFDGGVVVDFVWPVKEAGRDGKLCLSFIQFASMTEWLFARIKTEGIELNDYKVCFSARPGTPWLPAGGESWIATPSQDYQFEGKAFDIVPTQNAVAFYNKVQFEEYGNLLVYESEKYEKLGFTSQYGFYLKAKPNAGELHFGFGYFNKRPRAETVTRFLSEQSRSIFELMKNTDWNPKMDYSEFENDAKDVGKMMIAVPDEKHDIEFKRIVEKFNAGKKKGDAPECAQALVELNRLRAEIAKAGLESLK